MRGARVSVRRRSERGAVAIIAAVAMTALLITGGIVLDFGLARMDRTTNKSAADEAVAAGLQAANSGTGDVYSSSAVCGAYAFLKANRPALSGLPSDVCASVDPNATCTPEDTTHNYHATTTSGSGRFEVWIKMPYSVSDTTTGGPFADESLATSTSDPGEATQLGCDQLGVVIKEWTQPGLGKIVSSDEISTRVRSVARVKVGNGDPAPALLLLERTRCGVLQVGSAGSASRISVKGNSNSPGTIHSDSAASDSGCGNGSNSQLFQGKQADGIVAYGSTSGVSGLITSVATQNGKAADVVADSQSNVYATTATPGSGTGTPSAVTGRKAVTRKPVDKRYLNGVRDASRAANIVWNLSHSAPSGFTRYGCPNVPDMAAMATKTLSDSVYIDCPGSGITLNGTIGAGRIFFHGFIKGGVLRMPNATDVYVDDTTDSGGRDFASAITLGNGDAFCVRATTCLPGTPSAGPCSITATSDPAKKARLMIRRGSIDGTGLLRLCNTTAFLQGGDNGDGTTTNPGGCLPAAVGAAPTATPCLTSTATSPAGDGVLSTSGVVDWTAPNAYGDMTAAGLSMTQQQAQWDVGEDLALWTETYGTGPTYKLTGGADMHVAGVFMVPNAFPFNIAGGGSQDFTNAQFVVRAFSVGGGAIMTMKVDPNNVVGLPSLYDYRLVR
jgi:Flp pilus assembly protein TadG